MKDLFPPPVKLLRISGDEAPAPGVKLTACCVGCSLAPGKVTLVYQPRAAVEVYQ
jgi:hypothetical protein